MRRGCLAVLLVGLQGCLSPLALDHAVIAYDKATTDILGKQLLLNIGRAHQHQPIHFTGVSNIAATFNFQFSAGATPALTGESGSLLNPVFGGSLSENPTISIVPIEGEAFSRRLLTPFPENKLTMLLRQGVDIDLILRLLAGELRLNGQSAQHEVFLNKPSDADGYKLFRQAALHLSSIQDRHQLFIEPLMFDRQWTLPAQSFSADQLNSLQADYKIHLSNDKQWVTLSKRISRRIVLTNYDPAVLSNAERMALHEQAELSADNDLQVDIRPGYPGGEWPLQGVFRLRSFAHVLNFIGQGIADEPEYAVEPHPLTPFVHDNPVKTLGVSVSAAAPDNVGLSVALDGQYYALQPESGYPWNREGFRLLYQVFQMTMSDLGRQGAPNISIAK